MHMIASGLLGAEVRASSCFGLDFAQEMICCRGVTMSCPHCQARFRVFDESADFLAITITCKEVVVVGDGGLEPSGVTHGQLSGAAATVSVPCPWCRRAVVLPR